MHETYRMLGKAHESDLEREARKWQRTAEAARGGKRQKRAWVGPVLAVASALRLHARSMRRIAD